MDHLLRRVGSGPPSKHLLCKENPDGFPGSSMAACHAPNVASNAISFLSFCFASIRMHLHHRPFSVLHRTDASALQPSFLLERAFIPSSLLDDVRRGSGRSLACRSWAGFCRRNALQTGSADALSECNEVVVLPGFEPGSQAPKARMIDRYTTGLYADPAILCIKDKRQSAGTRHRPAAAGP